MSYDDYRWRPYVSVARRRRQAVLTIATLQRSGHVVSPVTIDGRTIARTFWGESWCRNLEAYSDYANRLPRGRTYVRNGSVLDLHIEHGRVHALVNGSSLYEIEIRPLARTKWSAIKSQCAGKIDSMVELLQGSISRGVMEVVTRKGAGLFPAPQDISLRCSCPDWATMCKHVAAALYGVGTRLDHAPEMLFTLRGVEPAELIAAAVSDAPTKRKSGRRRLLRTDDMSSVFGIELVTEAASKGDKAPQRTRRKKPATSKKKTTTRAAASRTRLASRSKATRKTAASRSKAAQKSASATSTHKKKPSSKTTQAVAAKTTTTRSSTGTLSARMQRAWKAAGRRRKKTAS